MLGVLVMMGALLVGCAAPPGPAASGGAARTTTTAAPTSAASSTATGPGAQNEPGDPNAAGRSSAAATMSATTIGSDAAAPMPGGGAAICANETLGESMDRDVQAGNSIVLATGGFTGTTTTGDGEVAAPYSEVRLTVEKTLAGPTQPVTLDGWVYGDLAAPVDVPATTGEASSLWARGGRLIAIVDNASAASGLPGPVIRVAPVLDDQLILSWVGCWSTAGVATVPFDGAVDIFDQQGVHPVDLDLQALPLQDFELLLAR